MTYKYSAFYYGHIVTENNRYINFNEGGLELTAILTRGAYTLTGYLNEIARAMTWYGGQNYTCEIDRETRIPTILAEDPFSLLFETGSNAAASIASMAGFEEEDLAAAISHEAVNPSGEAYFPQCPLNNYVPFKHWKGVSGAAVNVSAAGRSTIVSFGSLSRMKCNIYAITDLNLGDSSAIKNNPNAVQECLDFLDYITVKNPVEFMFDMDDPDVFDPCILESTKDSKEGVSFELYEGLGKGILNIYETNNLIFRKVE